MAAGAVFKEWTGIIEASPELVAKIQAVFEWNVAGSGTWVMDLKNGKGGIKEGKSEGKVDCTITLSEEDFLSMMKGEVTSQQLFVKGKLKVRGGTQHAFKLGDVLKMRLARAKL